MTDQQQPQKKNHRRDRRHVYLFRHCVRASIGEPSNVTNLDNSSLYWYVNEPLPDWHTTTGQGCTPRGLKIIEGEGQTIGQQLREEMRDLGKDKIRLRFIVDTTPRDSDTTFALIRGLNGVFPRDVLESTITFDQDLFQPTKADRTSFHYINTHPDPEYNATSLCQKKYKHHQYQLDQSEELRSFPRPEGGLLPMLKVMANLTGSDKWLEVDNAGNFTAETLEKIGLLKDLGTVIFSARASKLPPFLTSIDTDMMYRLMEWTFWIDSFANWNNSTATHQAPLAASILEALSEPDRSRSWDDPAESNTLMAYFYIGHDTNINGISSAFDIKYDLPPPYFTSPELSHKLSPAPPGGALHFVNNVGNGVVDISFLSPELISASGYVEDTIKLQTVPIGSATSLKILKEQVKKRFSSRIGALECFSQAKELPSWPHKDARNINSSSILDPLSMINIILSCLLTIGLLVLFKRLHWTSWKQLDDDDEDEWQQNLSADEREERSRIRVKRHRKILSEAVNIRYDEVPANALELSGSSKKNGRCPSGLAHETHSSLC